MPTPTLTILEHLFTIHRFAADASIPKEVTKADFFAVTRTGDELSVVAPADIELKSEQSDSDWACIQVNGPLKLSQVGRLPTCRRRWPKHRSAFSPSPPSIPTTCWSRQSNWSKPGPPWRLPATNSADRANRR